MSTLIVDVCKIDEIKEHTNADRLALALVKGWQVVVRKDTVQKGTMGIYIPPDSVLDEKLLNLLFPPGSEGVKAPSGGRLRTCRIRKELSEGMFVEFSEKLIEAYPKLKNTCMGDEVSEILNITKYEPKTPACLTGKASKRHPQLQKYHDIHNIKNFPDLFQDGDAVYVTEKLHGTSIHMGKLPKQNLTILERLHRFFTGKVKYEIVVSSRNVQLDLNSSGDNQTSVHIRAAKMLDLDKILAPGEVLYGEVVGPGIQKGYSYGVPNGEIDFYAYDVKYNGDFLPSYEFQEWCNDKGVKRVPLVHEGLFNPEELSNWSTGRSLVGNEKIREGVVVKSLFEIPGSRRRVLKSINPAYAVKDNTEFH